MVSLLFLVYRATDCDPIHISEGDLVDFFLHLLERVGLAAATIHAYKAAILSALEPRKSFTTSQLATLNKLLNSFHNRRPPKPSLVPDWYIGLVLKSFSLPPFEPIQQASVEVLTYQTLVLVTLALAAHKGGAYCSLSRSFFHSPSGELVFCVIIFRSIFHA